MLLVAVARPSVVDKAIRYVLRVSWMTPCFHIMVEIARIKDDALFRPVRQMAPVGRQTTMIDRGRQVAAPGSKSAVFDCILLAVCVVTTNLPCTVPDIILLVLHYVTHVT